MTTTVNGVTARSILARADKRWTDKSCDDPAPAEYLDHLAQAVQNHIAEHTPLPAPAADAAELQRLNDLVTELQNTIDARDHDLTRQVGEITAERDQLLAALDELRADVHTRVDQAVAKAIAAGKSEVDTLRARVDDLRVDLAQAQRDAQTWEAEYEPVHEHRYIVNTITRTLDPCTCGLVFPRDTLANHQEDDEDLDDETEPISVLFDRLRIQLADWGDPR